MDLFITLRLLSGFSAIKYCRFCEITGVDAHQTARQKENLLRTRDSFMRDLERKNPKLTGVKFNSILNSLDTFHVTETFSPDIMHDLLEGVCKFDVVFMLSHFIKNKIFSMEYLNHTIST